MFLKSLILNIARASYNVFYYPFKKEKVYFMELQSENIYFKSLAVWQNENHSVAAEPWISQQGVTLKSCSNNIKADMAPLL